MILVIGATGKVGSNVCKELAAAGAPVRAFVRNKEKATAMLPPQVELFQGDLLAKEHLDKSLAGVEKMFLVTPVNQKMAEVEKFLVDAAKRDGVKHVVKLSVIHADADSPAYFAGQHGLSERLLRESGMDWTMLRPNFFMQNLLGTAMTVRMQGVIYQPAADASASSIDARDIAAVAAKVLTSDGHAGKAYVLTGPQSLTYQQIAEILTKVRGGNAVRYVPLPPAAAKQGMMQLGFPEWLAQAISELFDAMRDGVMAPVTDEVQRITGKPPRTFEVFATENKAAFGA